ncbi:DUF7701 domain-containing protein [Brevibacterium samyangense]|uniref:DUF7701 domain-containing protein n=1 Tax=Brevibacterium samyangense TaxID=366888 RepID=A0ABN2TJJ7_9MICO
MALNYIDEIAALIEATLDPEQRPDDDAWALYRLYALLVLVKGVDVSLEDVHDAWSVWMATINPKHDALVPFSSLDPAKRSEDGPYARAIAAVARGLNSQSFDGTGVR